MANEERKIRYGIKGKLISAIAMLLVAVIMTVSSTYAWFTLSTAPEVTGISTAVGANGALEMALLMQNGEGAWGYQTADGVNGDKNTTWGNLVDLSDDKKYGSGEIVLYPSKLNMAGDKLNTGSFLSYPQYGADGRVNATAGALVGGEYIDGRGFVENNKYGFRAVGSASGMTARQIAHRNAYLDVGTFMGRAKTAAYNSLTTKGSTIAQIAVLKVAMDSPAFTNEHADAINTMLTELGGSLDNIDKAYQQAILAWAASSATNFEEVNVEIETFYTGVKAIVEADDTYPDAVSVLNAVNTQLPNWEEAIKASEAYTSLDQAKKGEFDAFLATIVVPTEITTGINQLTLTNSALTNARSAYSQLTYDCDENGATTSTTKDHYTYAALYSVLKYLVDTDAVKVNGYSTSQKNEIISSVFGGVTVSMPSGGGIYADIADQCGNYTATISIDLGLAGFENTAIPAQMTTDSELDTPYLSASIATTKNLKPADGNEVKPMSEFYGYIIDLAFRTNASSSNLLLQQNAIDRIYEDNNNEETMGGGSNMTLATNSPSFTAEKVRDLMANFRIIFFDPEEGTIYATAKLDSSNAALGEEGYIANMYLYEMVTAYTITTDKTVYIETTGEGESVTTTYYWDEGKQNPATGVTNVTPDANDSTRGTVSVTETVFRSEPETVTTDEGEAAVTTTTYRYYSNYYTQDNTTLVDTVSDDALNATIADTAETVEVVKEDRVITDLTQNQEKHVSVLVYLDGETMDNSDVAADVAQSLAGKANFQFASDANLVPMEYGDLYKPETTAP